MAKNVIKIPSQYAFLCVVSCG